MKKQKILPLAAITAVAAPLASYAVATVITKVIEQNEWNQMKSLMTGEVTKRYLLIDSNGVCTGIKPTSMNKVVEIVNKQTTNAQLVFPKEVKKIDGSAFANVFRTVMTGGQFSKYFTIKFSNTTKLEIGPCAFAGCDAINGFGTYDPEDPTKTTDMAEWQLQSIGQDSFKKCSQINSLTIPKTCTLIGKDAFNQCYQLSEITVTDPESGLSNVFQSGAFKSISYNGTLNVPSTMSIFEASSIASNLASDEIGGLNFYQDGGDAPWKVKKGSTEVKSLLHPVPTNYLNIDSANKLSGGIKFGSLSDYDSLYVPNSVKSIEADSFANNTSFKSLNWEVGSQCTRIGARAFASNVNLGTASVTGASSLVLPSKIKDIGAMAFYACSKYQKIDLSKITINSATRQLNFNSSAFSGWNHKETRDPNSVVYPQVPEEFVGTDFETKMKNRVGRLLWQCGIDESWFAEFEIETTDISSLTDGIKIDENGNVTSFTMDFDSIPLSTNAITFDSVSTGEPITTIPAGLTYNPITGENALNNTNIKYINLNRAQTISERSFKNASKVTAVTFAAECQAIKEEAFAGCKSIIGIELPAALETIGARAFKDCSGAYYLDLKNMTYDAIMKLDIGENAFAGWNANGGTITYPNDLSDEQKAAIANKFTAAGLPSTWVDTEGGVDPATPSEQANVVPTSCLIYDTEETTKLTGIKWDDLATAWEQGGKQPLLLAIPTDVTEIADNFWASGTGTANYDMICGVQFPTSSNCTKIGKNAFKGAFTTNVGENYKDLILPSSIEKIDTGAFANCTGLTGTLTFGQNTTFISGELGEDDKGAFQNTGFKRFNFANISIEAWDRMLESEASGTIPIGTNAFLGETGVRNDIELVIFPTFMNTSDYAYAKEKFQDWLINPGMLPDSIFGINPTEYESKVTPYELDDFADAGIPAAADDYSKQQIVDLYIDALNDGLPEQGLTGAEIFENDILQTAHNYIQREWSESEQHGIKISNSIKVSDIEIEGPYVSFTITGFINANVSDGFLLFNYEFSTHFDHLKIIGFDPEEPIAKEYTHPIGSLSPGKTQLALWGDNVTKVYSTYDVAKLFMKNGSDLYDSFTGWEIYQTAEQPGAIGTDFDTLNTTYDSETIYYGDEADGLYAAAAKVFKSAPSLMCSMFGVGDVIQPFNQYTGGDTTSKVYCPLVEQDESAKRLGISKNHNFLALNATLIEKAPVLPEFNVETGLINNFNMSEANFTTNKTSLSGTIDEKTALADYKKYLCKDMESYQYSKNLYLDFILGMSKLFNITGQIRKTQTFEGTTKKFSDWSESYFATKITSFADGSTYEGIRELNFEIGNSFTDGDYDYGREWPFIYGICEATSLNGQNTTFKISTGNAHPIVAVKAFTLASSPVNCACIKLGSYGDQTEAGQDETDVFYCTQTYLQYYYKDDSTLKINYNIQNVYNSFTVNDIWTKILSVNTAEKGQAPVWVKATKEQAENNLKTYLPAFYYNNIFKIIQDPDNTDNLELVLIYPTTYFEDVIIGGK